MPRAYVGLGSNLGDREHMIWGAVHMLTFSPEVQPPFLNAAAALDTELGPRALLDLLLTVERELGRTRPGPRFGPRTIDLDLLLYGDDVIDEPGLSVPHPRLHERLFALEPLAELDPDLVVPGHGSVQALLAGLQFS